MLVIDNRRVLGLCKTIGGYGMEPQVNKYKHKKTGSMYEVICQPLSESDSTPQTVYQSLKYGNLWVRPTSEFIEKFEMVEACENNNIPDVSDTDVGESFDQKISRIMKSMFNKLGCFDYLLARKAVELAIAEEREASCCLRKAVADVLRDALDSVYVHPCDLSNDEVLAKGLYGPMLKLYEVFNTAPKDEVSE